MYAYQFSIDPIIPEILKLPGDIVGCEIGVNEGDSVYSTLEKVDAIKTIYGIDPYVQYVDHYNWDPEPPMRKFLSKMIGWENKINFIRKTSNEAKDDLPDGILDYIFIDGDHTYNAALQDMRNYYSKVRSGGLFSGHDWPCPPVQQAVYDFIDEIKLDKTRLQVIHGCWFWYKD